MPDAVNTQVPNVARMYDFWLGGKDNFAADRAAAEHVVDFSGGWVLREVRANREFLGRAVRFAAESGIDQFLDIGSGLPTQDNVHDVARRTRPDARVVYADYDPVVCAHGDALLAGADGVSFIVGDLRDPDAILEKARGDLDFDRPVALILVAVLHFVPEAADPAALVARVRDRLAPGSMLILSHLTGDWQTSEQLAEAKDVYARATAGLVPRSRDQVERLFDGFELLPPGLVPTPLWRPDGEPPQDGDQFPIVAGAARR